MENGDNKMTYIPTEKEIEMCEEMAQDNWDEEEEYEVDSDGRPLKSSKFTVGDPFWF